MGDIFIFNPTADAIHMPGNVAAAKKQWVAGSKRKGLADITNLPASKKKLSDDQEHIQQLRQENAALMKQLVERNKTIQLCGIELQKLRFNLQNSQQQNRHLAQANSQILAQLNAGKDKLKVLEHELACRKNLVAVKTLRFLEVKKSGQCREILIENTTSREAGASPLADDNNDKPCSTNSIQHSAVQGHSVVESARTEEDPNRKRHRTRRQSSRFKSEDLELANNIIDRNDVALPACHQSVDKRLEVSPTSNISQEASEEALVSSSGDIDGGRPWISNVKNPRRAKRGSSAKCASNNKKSEATRPHVRTRSSMLKTEEPEDLKVGAKFIVSPQNHNRNLEDCAIPLSLPANAKDVVQEDPDLSAVEETGKLQDVKVTLQKEPCSSGPESREQRGMSTTKGASHVEKTELKRPCIRRQSSRLKCKDEKTGERCPQNEDNEEPENHSIPPSLSGKTEKTEREETDVQPEQMKKSSVGRPLRSSSLKSKDEQPSGRQSQNDGNEDPKDHSIPPSLSENTTKRVSEDTDVLPEQSKRSSVGRPLRSSRLKCKDQDPSECHPQNDDNEVPKNRSGPSSLSENTVKMERESTDVLLEQTKRSSVGRPLRRAAEKVQSYKEVPLKAKMRRPE